MVEAVTDALVAIAGSDIRGHITASVCTGWESDPLFRGAYAAAQPGHALARLDLARPIDNGLWFAGEATSPEFFSTCHGAHLTGIATVDAIHEDRDRSSV
jgi:monoamine oxidase